MMPTLAVPALRGHMMFWSVTVALMLIDDAAMIALLFC